MSKFILLELGGILLVYYSGASALIEQGFREIQRDSRTAWQRGGHQRSREWPYGSCFAEFS